MKSMWFVAVALAAAGAVGGAEKKEAKGPSVPPELKARWKEESKLPVVDLSQDAARQVVVAAGTKDAGRKNDVLRVVRESWRGGGTHGAQR